MTTPPRQITAFPLVIYGTLQHPQVQKILFGEVMEMSPVHVLNVAAYTVNGKYFPALVSAQGSTVPGFLLETISLEQLKILNTFEDVRYILRPVTYRRQEKPKTLGHALSYSWSGSLDELGEKWQYEVWEELWSVGYIEQTQQWKRRYDLDSQRGEGAD